MAFKLSSERKTTLLILVLPKKNRYIARRMVLPGTLLVENIVGTC